MATGNLDRVLQVLSAVLALLLRFEFLEVFEVVGLFFIHVGIVDSSPSLFLSPLVVFLHFPACLVVGAIVNIDATVPKHTIPAIMEILA